VIRYFYGEDTYASEEAVRDLARELQADIQWLDREELQTQPLATRLHEGGRTLFGARLLVVRDVARLPVSFHADIIQTLERWPAGQWGVFWDRGVPDKRSRWWLAMRRFAQECAPLSERELVAWIRSEGERRGLALELTVARRLAASSVDRWRLIAEIEKMSLGGQAEIAASQEADIFAVVRQVAEGKSAQALTGVEQLLAQGASEFYIFSLLSYQFRLLHAIKWGQERGWSRERVAQYFGVAPFAAERHWNAAAQFQRPALLGHLLKIAAAEAAIKTGILEARTSLLMLIVGMGSRHRSRAT
jgi:DNA polymerase III delta subunit